MRNWFNEVVAAFKLSIKQTFCKHQDEAQHMDNSCYVTQCKKCGAVSVYGG